MADQPFITLPADQPDFETLTELTMAEKAALPTRFHTPVWSNSIPGAFICRVCWTEGEMTSWPCASALREGWHLFGPDQKPAPRRVVNVNSGNVTGTLIQTGHIGGRVRRG